MVNILTIFRDESYVSPGPGTTGQHRRGSQVTTPKHSGFIPAHLPSVGEWAYYSSNIIVPSPRNILGGGYKAAIAAMSVIMIACDRRQLRLVLRTGAQYLVSIVKQPNKSVQTER